MCYNDKFLESLGEWQNGWHEDSVLKNEIITRLKNSLPDDAVCTALRELPTAPCYRKRFLSAENNCGTNDFSDLIFRNKIDEGISSWTTEYEFAREFKGDIRENCITAIFKLTPTKNEIIVNINALWKDPVFKSAVSAYTGPFSTALKNFKDSQGEVIIETPLSSEQIVAFVGKASSVAIFKKHTGVSTEEDEDELYKKFCQINAFPEDIVWINEDQSQRAIQKTKEKYKKLTPKYRNHYKMRLLVSTIMSGPY